MKIKINIFTNSQSIFQETAQKILKGVRANNIIVRRDAVKNGDFEIVRTALNDSTRGIVGHFSIVDSHYIGMLNMNSKASFHDMYKIIKQSMRSNSDLIKTLQFMDSVNCDYYKSFAEKVLYTSDKDFSIITKAIKYVIYSNQFFEGDKRGGFIPISEYGKLAVFTDEGYFLSKEESKQLLDNFSKALKEIVGQHDKKLSEEDRLLQFTKQVSQDINPLEFTIKFFDKDGNEYEN